MQRRPRLPSQQFGAPANSQGQGPPPRLHGQVPYSANAPVGGTQPPIPTGYGNTPAVTPSSYETDTSKARRRQLGGILGHTATLPSHSTPCRIAVGLLFFLGVCLLVFMGVRMFSWQSASLDVATSMPYETIEIDTNTPVAAVSDADEVEEDKSSERRRKKMKKNMLQNQKQLKRKAKAARDLRIEEQRKRATLTHKAHPDGVTAVFTNQLDKVVSVYWVDGNDKEDLLRQLAPGEGYHDGTYFGHTFVLRADGGYDERATVTRAGYEFVILEDGVETIPSGEDEDNNDEEKDEAEDDVTKRAAARIPGLSRAQRMGSRNRLRPIKSRVPKKESETRRARVPARAVSDPTERTVTFVNQLDTAVTITWIDDKGLENLWADVPSGDSTSAITHIGHVFIARASPEYRTDHEIVREAFTYYIKPEDAPTPPPVLPVRDLNQARTRNQGRTQNQNSGVVNQNQNRASGNQNQGRAQDNQFQRSNDNRQPNSAANSAQQRISAMQQERDYQLQQQSEHARRRVAEANQQRQAHDAQQQERFRNDQRIRQGEEQQRQQAEQQRQRQVQQMTVQFNNRLAGVASVSWLDEQGRETLLTNIQPGVSYSSMTYVGHEFRVRGPEGYLKDFTVQQGVAQYMLQW